MWTSHIGARYSAWSTKIPSYIHLDVRRRISNSQISSCVCVCVSVSRIPNLWRIISTAQHSLSKFIYSANISWMFSAADASTALISLVTFCFWLAQTDFIMRFWHIALAWARFDAPAPRNCLLCMYTNEMHLHHHHGSVLFCSSSPV